MSTSQQSPIEDLHEKATLRARVVELERENDLVKQAQPAHTEAGRGLQTSGTEGTPELASLQQIYGEAPIGLCYLDTNLRFVFINEWLAAINGLSVKEHLGRPISEVLPDVAAGVEAQLRGVIETGEPVVGGTVKAETAAEQGVKRHFQHNYDAIRSADGAIVGVTCVVQDITERKQAEESLRENEERMRLLIESAFEGIIIADKGKILEANQAFADMYGYALEEVIGLSPVELTTPESAAKIAERIAIGDEKLYEFVGLKKDGTLLDVEVVGKNCTYRGRDVRITAMRDITERKRAEEALRSSQGQLRLITDNVLAFIAYVDSNQCYRFVNKRYAEVVGFRQEEIIGYHMKDVVGQLAFDAIREHIEYALSGEHIEFEAMLPLKSGKSIWVRVTYVPDFAGPKSVQGIYIVGHDITERKRAEEALSASEERFRTTFESAAIAMALDDEQGRLIETNAAFQKMFGYSAQELEGVAFSQLTHPEDIDCGWNPFKELVQGKRDSFHLRKRYYRKDGTLLWGSVNVSAIRNRDGSFHHTVAMVEDITARKGAEEQARQLQADLAHMSRLSTMGEMASGLAHELNQPLTAITNYAQGCVRRLKSNAIGPDELGDILGRIATQARRSGSIIRGLENLVRKSSALRFEIDINHCIMGVADLANAEATQHHAKARFELEPNLPLVMADQTQLQQVILNLVQNGCEAIQDTPESRRAVTVRTKQRGDTELEISVSDNGRGISESPGERLFEPFFTTKAQGIGMGLAISRSIVESHGGRLWATPNRGEGTTFHFTLPILGGHDGDE